MCVECYQPFNLFVGTSNTHPNCQQIDQRTDMMQKLFLAKTLLRLDQLSWNWIELSLIERPVSCWEPLVEKTRGQILSL